MHEQLRYLPIFFSEEDNNSNFFMRIKYNEEQKEREAFPLFSCELLYTSLNHQNFLKVKYQKLPEGKKKALLGALTLLDFPEENKEILY